MKILIAPLNWGLGHASRCVPIIRRLCREGHQVVLGGDGDALLYLQQRFPQLRSIELAQLHLTYSKGNRQVWAMLRAIPKLILFSIRDHRLLRRIQCQENFDEIISDNRFGLWFPKTLNSKHSTLNSPLSTRPATLNSKLSTLNSIYITHQLHIMLPRPYHWLESFASRLHACIYRKYDEVWVPDTPDHRLSGDLSTINFQLSTRPATLNSKLARRASTLNLKYIGPLSRFNSFNSPLSTQPATLNSQHSTLNSQHSTLNSQYKAVALFSGLEPHRTMFERAVLERFKGHEEDVLLVNGKLDRQLSDEELAYFLQHAERIIARSGYSTIMDLDALGVLDKAEFIPTPGQPEQEYLAKKICIIQKKVVSLRRLMKRLTISGERPMFASRQVHFDGLNIGPGESAFKKSRGVSVSRARVEGMYAFWECSDVVCEHSVFMSSARACSWYGKHHIYRHCQISAPKMFRELTDLTVEDVRITKGSEFFWKCKQGRLQDIVMRRAEYAFLHAEKIVIENLQLQGKYIFQYAGHIELHNAVLATKDAFWESKDCTVYDSVINGEYLGWYSKNLRLVRCHISGTQPLCYCKNLILEDCTFDASSDRCFEHSSVRGTIIGGVTSVTPPMRGQITCL